VTFLPPFTDLELENFILKVVRFTAGRRRSTWRILASACTRALQRVR
jgi:hypothetical protein